MVSTRLDRSGLEAACGYGRGDPVRRLALATFHAACQRWPIIRNADVTLEPIASQRVPHLMAIVPFPGTDWTNVERAEIRRLELVCDASKDWSLECSHTDKGDPWCIVYDRHQERVILHIARIDRQYVLVWPSEQRSEKHSIMAVFIDLALEGLKSHRRRAS